MPVACLHDKDAVEACLRRDETLHAYELGDLDDFYWPNTTWYALEPYGTARQIALIYSASDLPVLLAFTRRVDEMRELLRPMVHLLPRRFYAHLTPGLTDALEGHYCADRHGRFLKMALADRARLFAVDTERAFALTQDDRDELSDLYRASYPGNWFDPRMLSTGKYFGLREGGELAAVAGVHVYSPRYGVAALGNIATHPASRGRGLATIVTARLCRELLGEVSLIGLNVKADNAPAIACYTRLGFSPVAPYEEVTFTASL